MLNGIPEKGDILKARLFPEPYEKNGVQANSPFPKHAFDKQVGKTIPMVLDGNNIGAVKVLSVVVADDGSYADLEYEVV